MQKRYTLQVMTVVMLVAALLLLLTSCGKSTTVNQKEDTHAVEMHGSNAQKAWAGVGQCSNDSLAVYYCQDSSHYVFQHHVLVCRNSGWCSGVVVAEDGTATKAYVAPCAEWDNVIESCSLALALNE